MPNTLREVTLDAKESLQDQITSEHLTEEQAQDRVYEIANNCLPVYYYDVLHIAQSSIIIALEIPDAWLAPNEATPMNLMMSNIHECICEALYELLQSHDFSEEE